MAVIDSGPAVCDWKVYAGDANRQTIAFFASEGVPWDLTGATLRAQARSTATDAAVLVDAVCTITDPPGGLATVEWDGEAVRAALAGSASLTGVWDLEVMEAGQPLPVTLFKGSWSAAMDVTKDAPP